MLVRYDKILKIFFVQQNQCLRNISFVLPVNASNALLFNIYHCFFNLFIPRSQGVIPCVEGFIFAV